MCIFNERFRNSISTSRVLSIPIPSHRLGSVTEVVDRFFRDWGMDIETNGLFIQRFDVRR